MHNIINNANATSQGVYKCFRGSQSLPLLCEISSKYSLQKSHRIRNRNKNFLKAIEESKNSKLIKFSLDIEKKIERKLRSKSELDSLFELCQLTPWRSCHRLRVDQNNSETLIYLDFKNFYPSILCSSSFPSPNKLRCYKTKTMPSEPGLVRVLLHTKPSCPNRIKEVHPFLIQSSLKGCPFYIDNSIETLIHTNEISMWSEYFELEPIEAITSDQNIVHPLKNKILRLLNELDTLREKDPENPRIKELKLFINCATTTPKIGQNKLLPSPFGVHCLHSQIVSNGKALLFDAIHRLLNIEHTEILQINTDGFLIKCPKDMENPLLSHKLVGNLPGQLCLRAKGNSALLLGPNIWWLTQNHQIVCELGTGRDPNLWKSTPIPTHMSYESPRNPRNPRDPRDPNRHEHTINLLHLADYRHSLNPKTSTRKKFKIPENMRQSPLTPFVLIEKEKKRSWQTTEREFKKFRETTS